MKYRILEADTADELENRVVDALDHGWALLGGVSVARSFAGWDDEREGYTECSTGFTYAQAMTYEN